LRSMGFTFIVISVIYITLTLYGMILVLDTTEYCSYKNTSYNKADDYISHAECSFARNN
jgi:hypothetical protein